jgi:hypothetical protein
LRTFSLAEKNIQGCRDLGEPRNKVAVHVAKAKEGTKFALYGRWFRCF